MEPQIVAFEKKSRIMLICVLLIIRFSIFERIETLRENNNKALLIFQYF